ncbi:archaetidylserine decarboxylase [Pseudohalioglobus lutimaris]|uniref:Phosphatidylserine decarboxylase proenzyme n=1 Tax=Pseudohalioglobus lutimaris TaxID=1737061 RepID=A0A2N5X1R0_9GAMM|nr:archaetidylserine decarboxylase [Pseudohalioglobus lutimaris]PLW68425.1 phosphatidylserine decarboxylase [Pseudohalioglobus lutimaris]
MDKLFIIFQHLVPQHLLSRCTAWLAELEHPAALKNWVIGRFVRHFNVDMSEALEPDYRQYANFNAFFTRPLRAGARAVADADVVCPADGAISQLGDIVGGRIFQAKGQDYSCVELLGGDPEWAARFAGGKFATIYLSPRDYHRVHMPIAGKLLGTTYIPGDLFSVNTVTAENVERLFARNERLVSYFDTEAGPMAMILVGAMVVAGIETVWGGQVAPPPSTPLSLDYRAQPEPVALAAGEEMGRFKLGSTVILLFPEGAIEWDSGYAATTPTRLGEALARFNNAAE